MIGLRANALINDFFHHVTDILAGLPAGDLQTKLEGALLLVRRKFFNQAPTASPLQTATKSDGRILGSIAGRDPEGDAVTYTVVGGPQFGTVEVDASGGYSYTPGSDYTGADSFTVRVACQTQGANLLNLFGNVRSTDVQVKVGAGAPTNPFTGAADAALGLTGASARISVTKKQGRFNVTVALTNTTPDTQINWMDDAGRWGAVSLADMASTYWAGYAGAAERSGGGVTFGVAYQAGDGTAQAVILNHAQATLNPDGQVVFSGDLAPDAASKTGYTNDFWDIVGTDFKTQYEAFRKQYIEGKHFTPASFDVSGADVYADTYSLSDFKAHVASTPGERLPTTSPTLNTSPLLAGATTAPALPIFDTGVLATVSTKDGNVFAAFTNGQVSQWNGTNWQDLRAPLAVPNPYTSVQVGAVSTLLAYGDGFIAGTTDGKVQQWDPTSGWTTMRQTPQSQVTTIVPFKTGVLVASTDSRNTSTAIDQWDGTTWQTNSSWSEAGLAINDALVTYNDRCAVALADGRIYEYDGQTWSKIRDDSVEILPASPNAVTAMVALKDSTGFVIGQENGKLRQWTGTEWNDLSALDIGGIDRKLDSKVTALAQVSFGSNSGSFVAGLEDGTLLASYVKGGERVVEQLQDGQKFDSKAVRDILATEESGSFVVGLEDGSVWRFSGDVIDALKGYTTYRGWTDITQNADSAYKTGSLIPYGTGFVQSQYILEAGDVQIGRVATWTPEPAPCATPGCVDRGTWVRWDADPDPPSVDQLAKAIQFIQDARKNANSWDPSLSTLSSGALGPDLAALGASHQKVEITAQLDDPQGLILGFADGSLAQWKGITGSPTDGTAPPLTLQSDGATVLNGQWSILRAAVANYTPLSSPSETQPYATSAITAIARFGDGYVIGTQGGQIYRCTSSTGVGCEGPLPQTTTTNTLTQGDSLTIGQSLTSANGVYTLKLESDGNLVLRNFRGDFIWSTAPTGTGAERARLQDDGNFVLYDGADNATWNTETAGTSSAVTPLPTVSVASSGLIGSAAEGNVSQYRTARFTVTLSQSSDQTVGVRYSTVDASATAGLDYEATSGTLSFAPGETSKTVDVKIIGDNVVETDETLTLSVQPPTGNTGVKLVVQDDRNIVLYDSNGTALWNSNTSTTDPAGPWTPIGTAASGPVRTMLPFTNSGQSTLLIAATSWSKSVGSAENAQTQVYEWDGQTLTSRADWGDNEGVLTAATTYRDGTAAVFATTDGRIRQWDGKSWSELSGTGQEGVVTAMMAVNDTFGNGFVVGQRGTDGAAGEDPSMSQWTGTGWKSLGTLDSTVTAFAPVSFGSQQGSFVAGLEDGTLKASYIANGQRLVKQLQDGQKWGTMNGYLGAAPPVTTIIDTGNGSFVVGLSDGAVWQFSGDVAQALKGYQNYQGWKELRQQYLHHYGTELNGGETDLTDTVGSTSWGWNGWPNIPNGFNAGTGNAALIKSGGDLALIVNEKNGIFGNAFNNGDEINKTLVALYKSSGLPQVDNRGTSKTSDDVLKTDAARHLVLGPGWTDTTFPNLPATLATYGIATSADPLLGQSAFQPACQPTGCAGKFTYFSFVTDPEAPLSIPLKTFTFVRNDKNAATLGSQSNVMGEKTTAAPASLSLKMDLGITSYGYVYAPDSVWQLTNASKYVSAGSVTSLTYGPRLALQFNQQDAKTAAESVGDWSVDLPVYGMDPFNIVGPVAAGPGLFQVTAQGDLGVSALMNLPADFQDRAWSKKRLDLTMYNTDTWVSSYNTNQNPNVLRTLSVEGPSACQSGGSGSACTQVGNWVLDWSELAQVSGLEIGVSFTPSISASWGWYLPKGLSGVDMVNGVLESLSLAKVAATLNFPQALRLRVPLGTLKATGTITNDDGPPVDDGTAPAATGTATILNDDHDDSSEPIVSISNGIVSEGNSVTKAMQFTVSLSKAAAVPVTLRYQTADSTGRAGSDYVAADEQITFEPGQTSKTFTVDIIGDTAPETDETFTVTLSDLTGAVVPDHNYKMTFSTSGNLILEGGILSGFINALTKKVNIPLYKFEGDLATFGQ